MLRPNDLLRRQANFERTSDGISSTKASKSYKPGSSALRNLLPITAYLRSTLCSHPGLWNGITFGTAPLAGLCGLVGLIGLL